MAVKMSKSKPEVEFRYGGRLFLETGSSNISAVEIWYYNSIGGHLICVKFGRPVQNHTKMTVNGSKSKPDVEFQYGGRLFLETGSSNISAMD